MADKEILSIEDVAEMSGYTKSTIYSMVCRRLIPHYKPTPKKLLFLRSEVEAWLLSNRVPTNAELEIEANTSALKQRKKKDINP